MTRIPANKKEAASAAVAAGREDRFASSRGWKRRIRRPVRSEYAHSSVGGEWAASMLPKVSAAPVLPYTLRRVEVDAAIPKVPHPQIAAAVERKAETKRIAAEAGRNPSREALGDATCDQTERPCG